MFKPTAPELSVDPKAVEASITPNGKVDASELIGGFSALLRRPEPRATGYVAKFFGENGSDADQITAMGLTKFVDMGVRVKVYGLKDQVGKSLRADKSQPYPLLAEFVAKVKRPKSSISGQVAQLFAENGDAADIVSLLGKTSLLDALVHVEIYPLGVFEVRDTPVEVLDAEALKLTPIERKITTGQEKKLTSLNQTLVIRGFYRQEALWINLGGAPAFRKWLLTKGCVWPALDPCPGQPVGVYHLPPHSDKYRCLPLCGHHQEEMRSKMPIMPENNKAFLETQHLRLQQNWVKEALNQELGMGPHAQSSPEKLIPWLEARGLKDLLPADYMMQAFAAD